jgi:hypothetical protein
MVQPYLYGLVPASRLQVSERHSFVDALNSMIRITDRKESGKTKLVLEGKLAGPCVRELEKCWLTSSQQQEIEVDLTSVGFIDDYGRQLLSRMHQKGIRLVSTRLMTKSLIEEIESEATSH